MLNDQIRKINGMRQIVMTAQGEDEGMFITNCDEKILVTAAIMDLTDAVNHLTMAVKEIGKSRIRVGPR